MLFDYLSYLFRAGNEHSIHSPFVFDLYTQVIRSHEHYAFYAFEEIESLREELLRSNQSLEVVDLGAGSRSHPKQLAKGSAVSVRKIKDIAAKAEKNARFGQLLFRLVNHFKPTIIFDLGTSLGITTLYLATPQLKSRVYTFEGCPNTAEVARQQFQAMKYAHICLTEGNLDTTLAAKVGEVETIDFAFFDANHRYQPTMQYFEACLAKAHEESVFIFDDIYWSEEMRKAWQEIKSHPRVMLSIDLFQVGLIFFRTNQPKQHFVLRF